MLYVLTYRLYFCNTEKEICLPVIPYKAQQKLTREIALCLLCEKKRGPPAGQKVKWCAGHSGVCEDVGQAQKMPGSSLPLFCTGMPSDCTLLGLCNLNPSGEPTSSSDWDSGKHEAGAQVYSVAAIYIQQRKEPCSWKEVKTVFSGSYQCSSLPHSQRLYQKVATK